MPDPRSRDPRKKAPENNADYDSMIATQIEMANKMAQQKTFDDIDYRSQNFRQSAPKTGILGGLFAPLPFNGVGGFNVNQNVFGSNPIPQTTKNASPPSLFDSNPSTSFAGSFNQGKILDIKIKNSTFMLHQ